MERINGIPARVLGRTGLKVTALAVGGFHMARSGDPDLGVRIVRTAIDEGINFLDNAWCYHNGESERVMGLALHDGYRDKVFLMTKNHGRDAATFREQLEQSLRRLQVDVIDVLQFHEIIHEGEPDRIFDDGAIEAAIKARDEGKIRFIGFTGHRWPRLFHEMLDKDFPWETVQMPVNALDHHYRSFTNGILPILTERGIGRIGMKSLGGSRNAVLESGLSAEEAISYSLSLPIDTLVSGMESLDDLRENLRIVRNWEPIDESARQALLDRVSPQAQDGRLEYYKTG